MPLQRSRLLRVLVAIGLVTLAAVGLRLSEGAEDTDFEIARGVRGEAVQVNHGTVAVRDVRVGTSLGRNDEVYADTPGLFVVVRVELAATGAGGMAGYNARLLNDDRRYEEFSTDRTIAVPPGFVGETDLVFEVDPGWLADLTLDLDPGEIIVAYPEHVRIHLGITADNAEQWQAAGRDQVVVPQPRSTRGI